MGKKRNVASPNHWSDIVGMPDDWDKKNLTNLINKFKKQTFTFTDKNGKKNKASGQAWIKHEVENAKHQHQTKGEDNPYGLKIKDSETRIGTAMPNVLWAEIVEAYPTMFRDQKHFTWFVKNFPEFKVAKKF